MERAQLRTLQYWLLAFVLFAVSAGQAAAPAVRRIGYLEAGDPPSPDELLSQSARLLELGWIEGKNLLAERRYALGHLDALPSLAKDLVQANVEVIVANGPNPTLAAMHATTTIQIVFPGVSDPVRSGLVSNLARPGGNVTGISMGGDEVYIKGWTLLKELVPNLRRVGVLEISGNPQFGRLRKISEPTFRSMGIEPVYVEIVATDEIDAAIADLAGRKVQAVVLAEDSFTGKHQAEIIAAALKRNLAPMGYPESGGLFGYGPARAEFARRAASYIDRILRGAKPADLPVEQPTQFELVLNLKTAKALGITVPQSMLLRSTEVLR